MKYTVVWSGFSETQLDEIFTYYAENGSIEVAGKLINKILSDVAILESTPLVGQVEELLKGRPIVYRYLVCGHHKIIYSVDVKNKMVKVTDVFDTRQNPEKIKRKK